MKNLLTATLPALALLALGGCASTAGLATSEDDGVYYSSKDRTTAVAASSGSYRGQGQSQGSNSGGYNQPTPAQAQTDEAANPDYNGNTGSAQSGSSTQYYDDNAATNGNSAYNQGYNNGYNNGRSSSIFHSPYAGPGVAYYAPPMYAPYTVIAVPSYGWGGGYCGFSPYGGYGYDPFYSGFYGSGFSISFGYGFGGGYGYGRPYGWGSPYGGFYDPYWGGYYGRNYYGGYGGGYGGYYGGGYGGYYGGGYGGRPRNVVYTGSGNYGDDRGAGNTVLVGPREGRGGDVTGGRAAGGATQGGNGRTGRWADENAGGGALPGGTGGRNISGQGASGQSAGAGNAPAAPTGRTGRFTEDGGGKGGYNQPTPITGNNGGSRYGEAPTGALQNTAAPTGKYETNGYGGTRPVRMAPVDGAAPSTKDLYYSQPAVAGEEVRGGRRGGRFADNNPGYNQPQPQAQPQAQPQGEAVPGGKRGGFFGGDAQPQPQRTYEQPQRTSERPQRTYEAPQRTYEQPQRNYERPASNGGGNSGGGGGGRSGRW